METPCGMGFGRIIIAALVAACLCLPVQAGAEEARPAECGTSLLRIRHVHRVDLDHACEAWRRVAGFLLEGRGLRVTKPIDLVFAERVEVELGAESLRVLGYFNRPARLIRITSMTADWLREPDRLMFLQPVDAELHISLIVHELSHAVIMENVRTAEPCRTGSEYLAYVTQLSTMEPGTRARVLAAYTAGDFASVDQITEIHHLLRPHEFGVQAYRHFAREGHAYMVELILSGRLQTDLPPL